MTMDASTIDYKWEVPVQLIPIVVDKDGAELQSSSFAQALRKSLLDFSAKASILKKVGRYFDYEVYEEKVRGNTSVNVLCRVTKESDLHEFEERFYSDQLAKSLEQYLTSVGFHWDLNIGYGNKKKEFKLKVIIERKCFTQKPTDFSKISRASKLEVEDKLKRKHESEIGQNTGAKKSPGSYPDNKSFGSLSPLGYNFHEKTRRVSFRIHIPGDVKKILGVTLCSILFKEIDGFDLKNIPDTNLWEVELEIPSYRQHFPYNYCIVYDESIHLNLKIVKWQLFGKTKVYTTETFHSNASHVQIQFAFHDYEEVVDGYFSHCYYIFLSVKKGEEHEYMTQMEEMKDLSSHLDVEGKKRIIERMIKIAQEKHLTTMEHCAVFVSFLVQINIPGKVLQTFFPPQFSGTLLRRCSRVPIELIPKSQQSDYFKVIEMVYHCVEGDDANFLSFCIYTYPLYDADMCSKMLIDVKVSKSSINKLHADFEGAKHDLKALVQKMLQDAPMKGALSKEISFLEKLQRSLPFDLQVVMFETLKIINAVPLTSFLEILHSACERRLGELSKSGNILVLISDWEKMMRCSVLSLEKIQEKAEKYLIESFDKANKNHLKSSYYKLKDMCIYGSLFENIDSKIRLLKKMATSLDEDVHSLVTCCLMEESFQNIPEEDVESIVLSWFECATKHHCGDTFKRNQLSDSLVSLYFYVGKIFSIQWLSSHDALLKKLDKRAFEYLKEVDVEDIIKTMSEIERQFKDGPTEDIFISHIQKLFKEGLANGDIDKKELYGQTKACVVNSKLKLQYFLTLMECSGLQTDMGSEEAFLLITSSHLLWKSVLAATGYKRDEICNNKYAMKAKQAIIDLKVAVEKKTIRLEMLQCLQDRRKLCMKLFTIVDENGCKEVEKSWNDIMKEKESITQNLQMTNDVFEEIKQRMNLDLPKKECVMFCMNFFHEKTSIMNQGDLNIADARNLIHYENLIEDIWEDCRNLREVVKSEVFWNIASEHYHELNVDADIEEDQGEFSLGIALLFEENEDDSESQIITELRKGHKFLLFLSVNVLQRFQEFWSPLLSGEDTCVVTVQKNLANSDIIPELELAQRICCRKATVRVHEALEKFSKFETQNEQVQLVKRVLNAFKVNVTEDQSFQDALSEYERLLEGEVEELTIFQIGESLKLVEKVVNIVDGNMLAVLEELQRSSLLIEFLQTVVDEDIRNLIDAVEEHSEQYVRESTVSDLIEVKRFLQPLLKQKYDENIKGFFTAIYRSLKTSGIKNVEQKIHECSSNLHSLKALYNHVANRGEHTKEIVESIVQRGKFSFLLKEKECDLAVEYKQDKKTHTYSKVYLNDLRSRSLLIINTEEKQGKTMTSPSRKEYLPSFIGLIDIALNICDMCVLLKEAGHFQFATFDRKKVRKEELRDLLNQMKSKYEDWCRILNECRRKYYLMNYIYSDQLQILYHFSKYGKNKESVITILKFINPDVKDVENVLSKFKKDVEDSSPEKILKVLGETLESIWTCLIPKGDKMFDKKPRSKLSEIVQAGRLYVAALEPDSPLVVRTLLALHWNTTQKVPLANNILLCNRNTSSDEITLFLNRCLKCNIDQLFSIANIELLTHETQDHLIDSLRVTEGSKSFRLALLCRGSSHHPFLEKFADFVMRPKPITENELQDFLGEKYPKVITVTSDVPGLGKSEEIHKLALQKDMGKVTLHVSGIFNRENIVEQLMRLAIKPYHILHIDVGPVDEPSELDSFLFELVVLRFVSARKSAFALQTDHICVEIANSVNQTLCNSLPTVTCFKRKNLTWGNYSDMYICQEVNSPVQVVCHYLQLLDLGQLDQADVYLTGNAKVKPLSPLVCRNLLQKHFSASGDLSYTVVNIFLGVLADQLKKLSSSVFFRTSNIQHQSVKSELVTALKNMSIDFSSRSINACRSAQIASIEVMDSSKHVKQASSMTCAEVLAKRTEGMIRWEDSNHLMVLFHHDLQTVSALYRCKDKVPKQISNLFESQLKKKLEDFSKQEETQLQAVLLKLVQHPSEIDTALGKISKRYALTPDNLLKMVLIVLRLKGHQPIVIMGETGCGKTSLIRYLSVVCQIDFQVLSIHAGVTEEMIVKKVFESDSKAKSNFRKSIWLFLDEINTCDHLGLICDIVCHHRCKGTLLSPNMKILAACNPYRLRSDSSVFTSGLQGKIKTDQLSKLVYRVHPLPETMIDYVWDYGSLKKEDEKAYIERMVHEGLDLGKLEKLLVNLLTMSQQFVQSEEGSDCCVSLRDVERCRRLVQWFVKMLKMKDKTHIYEPYKINIQAIILALSICYHSRFPSNDVRKQYREKVAQCCSEVPDLQLNGEGKVEKIIIDQQNDILKRMEMPMGTAKNTALRENVFVILVCILNRIPVFVVGKPGCSKSLSMQLIRSNLRGKDSSDPFFKALPQLYCVSFQGSESSTSDGIIKVFEKAKNYQKHNQSDDVMSVVILDEIGLAEISRFNPLKVLHSLLEPENQVTPDVAVVGISNWALDAAKMNRAIHLSRPEMDEKELYETSLSITMSLMSQPDPSQATKFSVKKKEDKVSKMTEDVKQLLNKLSVAYCTYNKNQQYKNFHGLRDFYSLTKYIGKGILDKQIEGIDQVILVGLLRNLGGLSFEMRRSMLSAFEQCLPSETQTDIDVLELIQDNLVDQQSRHLMLITNGDAVLSVLEDKIKEMERQHVVIFGSQFEEDLTDDYNYRILSRIILCMEQGYILILKDLENIYGSLYDMLNQNYTVVGSKKNCRVALGPYSNPMCHVHEDFKCIVLVEESKLDYSDPPFLNRFEKQQFRFEDMMNEMAINIRNGLTDFIADFCKIEGYSFEPEDVFAISGENILSSIVLKVQKEENDEDEQMIIQKCQIHLLWITMPEAVFRLKYSELWKTKANTVRRLEKEYLSLPIHCGLLKFLDQIHASTETMSSGSLVAVFTFDTDVLSILNSEIPEGVVTEKLGNFKSEKHLSQKIQHFFESDSCQLLLHCNVVEDFDHILLAKSTIENCKRNSSKKVTGLKNVCIICHLERQEDKHRTVTQINFLSDWKLAMLDTLCEPRTPLTEMMNLSVMEVLENRRPMTGTLKEYIFWAFTTIQYVGTGHTAEKMMKIVCNVQESEDTLAALEELVFSNIQKEAEKHIVEWQREVACDKHALLKASCYMHALEQYLLGLIKNPLCKIIFKLEEANALQSIFFKDGGQSDRFALWRSLTFKESLMNIAEIPDQSGPECYTCSSERLNLILPFSFVILTRIEKIKDDFLNTLKQLKISCELDEDDEIPKSLFRELVSKYKDIVEQDLMEYSDVDYPEKLPEYLHDFSLMNTSQKKGHLTEEERVGVIKWAHTLFGSKDLQNDFLLQVTHLHVLQWVYGSVLDSIVQVMSIVKKDTDVSIDEILHGMEEAPENDLVKEETADESESPMPLTVEIPTENDSESVEITTEEERDVFVDKLCKIFLPTTALLERFSSIREWQYLVSGVLPPFAEISLNPSSLHMLRFCNDVAQTILSLDSKDAVQVLSIFGNHLSEGLELESNEMFRLMLSQIKFMECEKKVNIIKLQRLVCLYLSRSIAINPEQNMTVAMLLSSIVDESVPDRSLRFLCPVLEIIIEVENEEDTIFDLIENKAGELEEGYLHSLNKCIEAQCKNEDSDSILSSQMVTIFQNLYACKVNKESLLMIEGSAHEILELAFKATSIIRSQKGCSLSLVASVAYLRTLLNVYVNLLKENDMNGNAIPIITKTINALMETGDEENYFGAQRTQCILVYLLKCLNSAVGLNDLKKCSNSLEEHLPVLKTLGWNSLFLSKNMTFHPISQYENDNKEFEQALLQMEEREEKHMKEIVAEVLKNYEKMFLFVGNLLNAFYLKGQLVEMSDTQKSTSAKIFEMLKDGLPKTQCQVANLVLKITDFKHPLFHLNTQTKAPDTQIVSVLTHLLVLIIFKGETGNIWHSMLTDPSHISSKYLPGMDVIEADESFDCNVQLCTLCKTRFFSSHGICPECNTQWKICEQNPEKLMKKRKIGYEKSRQNMIPNGNLSPIVYHLLKFFIHGCIALSLAANFSDPERIRTALSFKKEEETEEMLSEILQEEWRCIKTLTQMNDEEQCTLIHVAIYDMCILFTKSSAPNTCKTNEDREQLEKHFQAGIHKVLKEKYKSLMEARRSLCKKQEIDLSSLECQILEVSEIEGPQEKELMLPRLFRMTSPTIKDALKAQVFSEENSKEYPFLSLILKKEERLDLPKYILPILRWHQSTVSIGSYKMKKVDCKEETIEKFFRMENDETRRRLLKKRFEEFKASWNELLTKQNEQLETPFQEKDILSSNSKVIKCIITDENSVIQKVLLELVKVHNFFIDSCLHLASTTDAQSLNFLMVGDGQSRIKSTSLWELSSKDIITFTSWDDETLLYSECKEGDKGDRILRYSQCKSDFGEGKDRCYDLQKIESELAHGLILGKPYISVPSTFPRILFVDELFQNTIQLLESIRKSVPQEKLPQQVLKGILKKKDSDSSQITVLMTVLGMSLSLLKKTKGDPSLPLTEYLESWKDIAIFHKGYRRLLPEPEDAVKLCHVVSLYVKLEELNGETILETLDLKYREDLPQEGKEKLETIGGSYVGHLEVLAEALKIFIHRCLSGHDNTISLNQQLLDYIYDEEFWPQGSLEDENVSVGGHRKRLSEIVCSTLCVKHIYHTVRFIQDFIEEKQAMDHKIFSMTATYHASENQSKTATKKKNVRKKFGKT